MMWKRWLRLKAMLGVVAAMLAPAVRGADFEQRPSTDECAAVTADMLWARAAVQERCIGRVGQSGGSPLNSE